MLNQQGFQVLAKMSPPDRTLACKLLSKYDLRNLHAPDRHYVWTNFLGVRATDSQLARLVSAGFLEYGGEHAKMVRIPERLLLNPEDMESQNQPDMLKRETQSVKRNRAELGLAPFIPIVILDHAAKALGTDTGHLRNLMRDHRMPIYSDAILGSLMTVADFYKILHIVHPAYEKHRFDRQMFFQILSGLHSGEWADPSRPMAYDQRLEMELAKVAKLPQPERAMRSMEIWEAYRDAWRLIKDVRESVGKRPSIMADLVRKIMDSRRPITPPQSQSPRRELGDLPEIRLQQEMHREETMRTDSLQQP